MKNNCLNFLKGISCIGVIIMHCGFPTVVGDLIRYLFKFAVPIFFMISGYFAYYDNREIVKNKLPKKMIHIFKLTLIAEIGYAIYALLKNNFTISLNINTIEVLKKMLVGTFFNGTLWFLYALFWSYVALYIINKFNFYEISYKLAPVTLIFHVIFRICVKSAEWYDVIFFRNFIVYGLPFVMIGNYIHKNKEMLCEKMSNKKCLLGIIFGVILTVVEYLVTRQSLDFYIGTIIMSCSMFLYAIKNPKEKVNSILCAIGDKLSMHIYILHMIAIDISGQLGGLLNVDFYDWLKPIVAIFISMLLACLCRFILTLKDRKEEKCYGKN